MLPYLGVQWSRFKRWWRAGKDWDHAEHVPFVVEWEGRILYRGMCEPDLTYMQIDLLVGRRRKWVAVATGSGQRRLGVLRFYLQKVGEVYV